MAICGCCPGEWQAEASLKDLKVRNRGWLQDAAVRMAEVLEKIGSAIERLEWGASE
jgi:hypothetical protein